MIDPEEMAARRRQRSESPTKGQASVPSPMTAADSLVLSRFPSWDQVESFRRRILPGYDEYTGWDGFSKQERACWHAYDYAWRRVLLGEWRKACPADPDGKWFDELLVGHAVNLYRAKFRVAWRANKPSRKLTAEEGLTDEQWRQLKAAMYEMGEHLRVN